MATGRKITVDDLKSSLKSRMNQYEMLNKTLLEMFEKDSSESNIDAMRKAMNETLEDIKNLQELIGDKIQVNNNEKQTKTPSFYDGIRKPTLPKSVRVKRNAKICELKKEVDNAVNELGKIKEMCTNNIYDSIKKERKPSDDKEYEKKINYEEVYKNYKPYNHIDVSNKRQFPSILPYDDTIQTNRFLVKFNGGITIPEWYVRKVSFLSCKEEQLLLSVFDFVSSETNRPIIADILGLCDTTNSFSLTIEHIDPTGVVQYSERYHGCRISDVTRSDLFYESDSKSTIDMVITYSDITYETAH